VNATTVARFPGVLATRFTLIAVDKQYSLHCKLIGNSTNVFDVLFLAKFAN
jgi:hypothetical protein